ncbi:MAG: non-canonical purine NTP pyrophosphatase, partial [Caulobacterales bacterium]|nr:non-canonical purine NTP pyrophosphatase [Caulobacterales bacterium]
AALALPEPEETGDTYEANARLKADAAAAFCGMPSLADDSGLSVAALGGAPGVYSARWAGEPRDFAAAMERVRAELEALGATDRRAAFISVLALAVPGRETEIYEGRVEGTLTFPPRGENGFGYDPIFVPNGKRMTFGEMDPAEKMALNHRTRAFEKLVAARFRR